jgi:hypothetical protein
VYARMTGSSFSLSPILVLRNEDDGTATVCTVQQQSGQSAKLFLQSSELRLPQPLTRRRVCPPVLGGGAHSLAREGLGESQFRRGDIHCGVLNCLTVSGVGIKLALPLTLSFGAVSQ